jgi:phosphoglycolate phosphatase
MNNIRAVIFNCDGIIINSETEMVNAINATLDHFSMDKIPTEELLYHTDDDIKTLITHAVAASVKKSGLNPPDFPPQEMETILNWYTAYYDEHYIECIMLCPKINEVLFSLSEANKFTALISNKPLQTTEKTLEYFGIDDFFYGIIGSEMVKHRKPNPECIELALKEINMLGEHLPGSSSFSPVNPDEILVIGNSDIDIETGRAFGAHTCRVIDNNKNRHPVTIKADITIHHAGELCKILAL